MLAFAACSREYNYVKPELTALDVLKIKNGRFVFDNFLVLHSTGALEIPLCD